MSAEVEEPRRSTHPPPPGARFVVVSTALLSFVSLWRAAAIVLCDLGSSAYYVGGIAEQAIGASAPWFVLAIMLFSYAVRAVYIESSSMFVRGGVYRVVREAMGATMAKLSVSALLFDYVLTGPISGVSAGLYLASLVNETGEHAGIVWMHVPPRLCATAFALVVTLYFWHSNRVGVRFTSTKALRIMQITSVMVVILLVWCTITVILRGAQPVPFPTAANMHLSHEALGWLDGTLLAKIGAVGIFVGLGHSLLAMSGEESLAQVNREIAAPKLTNLKRAGAVIFVFSLLLTASVSFFAKAIIPDDVRARYFDNMIAGLSMFLVGPLPLRLAFNAFVVIVGVLILSGAVNTAILGSNGVLNRVAEDGVLPERMREVHPKYGTTYHIIDLIVGLQLVTILISRGDVFALGEAYAFGVVWSFAFKALAMIVLRFKRRERRRFMVPLNVRLGSIELPVGLALITLVLFLLAVVNLFTKKVATIAGTAFTVVIFAVLTFVERRYRKKNPGAPVSRAEEDEIEHFRLEAIAAVSPRALRIKPRAALVAVGHKNQMAQLLQVLDETPPGEQDVVVVHVRKAATGEGPMLKEEDSEILSRVVHIAEKEGKPVILLAARGPSPISLILDTATRLRAARVVLGQAMVDTPLAQEKRIVEAWRSLSAPRAGLMVEVVPPEGDPPWTVTLESRAAE